MAPKGILSPLSCIIFLISVTISLSSHASPSSPFTSVKHLQGCKKAENVKDLHRLKAYLQHFGYLNYQNRPNQSTQADDYFDDELEAALKTYQLNYRLKPTGNLDADTASKMAMPRCGVPDINNGTNHILANRNKRYSHYGDKNRKNLHTVSHFAFIEGYPRWAKKQLSYVIYNKMSPAFKTAIGGSFKKWASASGYFTFTPTANAQAADLKIGFERGDHGDGAPFDGPWSILAHATPPPYGTLHLDADEKWVVGAVADSMDIGMVALHEIGHLLGLHHSGVEEAIMYAATPVAAIKGLHADDIKGIKTLYNIK